MSEATPQPEVTRKALPVRVLLLWLLLGLTVAAFFNGLQNGFVYDDQKQILQNPYVQRLDLLPRGLLSDVWAFKGTGQAWSNYWRPGFTLWSAINWQLSGASPMGWHALNLGLHLIAVFLAFKLLRRLKFSLPVAAFASALFAVHPSRVESVTWVAGSPDILAAVALFACFLKLVEWRKHGSAGIPFVAILWFLAAVLCKEVYVAALALVPLVVWRADSQLDGAEGAEQGGLLKTLVPFGAVAVLFLIARYMVLGFFSRPFPDSPSLGQTILSAPQVLNFYVGQAFLPLGLGVQYDMRPATSADLGTAGYWMQIGILAVLVVASWFAARRWKEVAFGLVWFLVPILPALLIRSFRGDDLVHDRYLYLPILGLGVAIGYLMETGVRAAKAPPKVVYVPMATIAALCAALTFMYNPAWFDDVSLWQQSAAVSPRSSRAWTELGAAYQSAKQPAEAERAVEKALEVGPPKENTLVVYGMAARDQGNLEEARKRLTQAVKDFPYNYVGWENLAVVYSQMGDTAAAIQTFRDAASHMPSRKALYSVNIAVVLAQDGKKEEAIGELKPLRKELASAADPDVLKGLFYLGSLEAELGQNQEAASDLRTFISAAASSNDPEAQKFVAAADDLVQRLGMP